MNTPHILIVETKEGAYSGVKFASLELARAFEDHMGLTVIGCVPLRTQTQLILEGVKR